MFNISVLLKFVVILPMNFFFVWIYNSNDCVIAVCEWVKFLLTGSFRSSSYCQWFHIKFTGKTNGAFFINVKIRPFSFNQNTLPPLLAPTTLILKSVNWNFDVKKRIFYIVVYEVPSRLPHLWCMYVLKEKNVQEKLLVKNFKG